MTQANTTGEKKGEVEKYGKRNEKDGEGEEIRHVSKGKQGGKGS